MPRKKALKPFDDIAEQSVRDLLEITPRSQLSDFQKAVTIAINWAKVKHKIDEGTAGGAFGDDGEPQE